MLDKQLTNGTQTTNQEGSKMWYSPQEDRLQTVRFRQAEVSRDAREARLAGHARGARPALGRVSGLQLRLGVLLIVVGRTLREDDPPCPDLVRL